jgi:phosphate starvation-inducible PhoH-like protein
VSINARNANQKLYLTKLYEEATSIVLAIGPAGTGKTMLAVQFGVKLFQEGKVDRIVVTRPAVSVDEDLGFLPGDLNEKMAPWTRPIFDVLGEYYQKKEIANMLEEGVIEISPLAYMRGRTFKNAINTLGRRI